MTLDWLTLAFGVLTLVFALTRSRQLAGRSVRGTEWRPTRRTWLVVLGGAALMMIAGSLLNLLSA